MTTSEIIRARLYNQLLLRNGSANTPAGVVKHLLAVQGQDYAGAEWSIGLRIPGSTIRDVEDAISQKKIVRTWGLRGTLHFLAASDIRWILNLLAPRIIRGLARRYKELDLNAGTFLKAESILEKSLRGNKQLTRKELVAVLEDRGVSCAGQRAVFILHRASLDGVICFGVKQAKQETFALFDEWVPQAGGPGRDEALAELARRYFAGHGPATLQDFMWWSGLQAGDAKAGMESVKQEFEGTSFEGRTYLASGGSVLPKKSRESIRLLPPFDSLLLGYKDRSASIAPSVSGKLRTGGMPDATIVVDGRVAGKWRRIIKSSTVVIQTENFRKFSRSEDTALETAAGNYARFIGKKVESTE